MPNRNHTTCLLLFCCLAASLAVCLARGLWTAVVVHIVAGYLLDQHMRDLVAKGGSY